MRCSGCGCMSSRRFRSSARILDNAIRFSPKNDTVTITVARDDGRASVSISDRGPGLTQDEIEMAFDRLRQINRAQQEQQGVGLSPQPRALAGRDTRRRDKGRQHAWPGQHLHSCPSACGAAVLEVCPSRLENLSQDASLAAAAGRERCSAPARLPQPRPCLFARGRPIVPPSYYERGSGLPSSSLSSGSASSKRCSRPWFPR